MKEDVNLEKYYNNAKKKSKKNNKKKKKNAKSRIVLHLIKWIILIGMLISSIIFIMLSPLFNIIEIYTIGNKLVTTENIISNSKINIGDNIYKLNKAEITKNVKQNPYIDTVKISRKLPNKVEVEVTERVPTYMLEFGGAYIYISSQGYILEILQEKLNLPIIIGYSTNLDVIELGIKLVETDLEKLNTVYKILEVANGNDIGNLITKIDISNKENYTLILEEENKTIYLGNDINLTEKILYIKGILQREKGIAGEVFVNMDLDYNKAYFRPK